MFILILTTLNNRAVLGPLSYDLERFSKKHAQSPTIYMFPKNFSHLSTHVCLYKTPIMLRII